MNKNYIIPVKTLFGYPEDGGKNGNLELIIDALKKAGIDSPALKKEYEETRILPSDFENIVKHCTNTKKLLEAASKEISEFKTQTMETQLSNFWITRTLQDIDFYLQTLEQDFGVTVSGEADIGASSSEF